MAKSEPKMFWTYFKFMDGKEWIVKSSDVQAFFPKHSKDFKPGQEYRCLWQEESTSESFDGYYEGKIICLASSLMELKSKVMTQHSVKKMPSNFNGLIMQEHSEEKPKGRWSGSESSKPQGSCSMASRTSRKEIESACGTSKSSASISSKSKKRQRGKSIAAPYQDQVKKSRMRSTIAEVEKSSLYGASAASSSSVKKTELQLKDEEIAKLKEQLKAARQLPSASTQVLTEDKEPDDVLTEVSDADKEASDFSDGSNGDDTWIPGKNHLSSSDSECSLNLGEKSKTSKTSFGTGEYKSQKFRPFSKVMSSSFSLDKSDSDRGSFAYDAKFKVEDDKYDSRDGLDDLGDVGQKGLDDLGDVGQKDNSKNLEEEERKKIDEDENQKEEAVGPLPSDGKTKTKKSKSPSQVKQVGLDLPLGTLKREAVALAVLKDLKGEESFKEDKHGKVDLGNGVEVKKEVWDDFIKTQKKPSLFLKKLSQAHYGHVGLAKRTLGKPRGKSVGKQEATPKKIETFIGAYRAYSKFLDPGLRDSDLPRIDREATSTLGQKMQDEARNKE